MILSSIFLHLDGRHFPADMCLKLKNQSRHITYCIQRSIKEEKYRTDNFNRIVIQGTLDPAYKIFINSESVANISIPFDEKKFRELSDIELHQYYVYLVKTGLTEFNKEITIPIEKMFEAIDELSKNNFIDAWIYQQKKSKKTKVSAKLACEMDAQEFRLQLTIDKDGKTIYDKEILKTTPNEISFHYEFKDLVLKDGFVEVTKRSPKNEVLIRIPLE